MNDYGKQIINQLKQFRFPSKVDMTSMPKKKKKMLLVFGAILLISAAYFGGAIGSILSPKSGLSFNLFTCIFRAFTTKTGFIGMLIMLLIIGGLFLILRVKGDIGGIFDSERNFTYSAKGSYGTSGMMSEERMKEIFDVVDYAAETDGIIVGETDDGKIVAIKTASPFNRNIAGVGSQGSNKSVALAINMIIQCVVRGESFVATDPKSELFEITAFMLKTMGYDVVQWNMINKENSNSCDILGEIENGKFMEVICNTIINNTLDGDDPDHFYDNIEKDVLKALNYYVYTTKPYGKKTLGEAYSMLLNYSADELDNIFADLRKTDPENPAIGPYMLFSKSPNNKGNAILGLGTRLGIFQESIVRQITGNAEIDFAAEAKRKTACFCITSDQDSTYDVLTTLMICIKIIKIVRYADSTKNRKCDVPVHFILDEFPNIGEIPDFKKKLGTMRSRGIGVDILCQNIPQMQDRYPGQQWEELLGGCDFRMLLGCNETTTSEYFGKLTGKTTIEVDSKRKTLNTLRLTNFTPQFAETSSVGQRDVMFEDEIRRLKPDELLLFVRGEKPLKLHKFGYYKHTAALNMRSIKTSEIIPPWRIKNGIDILTGEKAKTFDELIEEVAKDDSRLIIQDSDTYGPQRSKLLKDLKEVKRRGTAVCPEMYGFKENEESSETSESKHVSATKDAPIPSAEQQSEHVMDMSEKEAEGQPILNKEETPLEAKDNCEIPSIKPSPEDETVGKQDIKQNLSDVIEPMDIFRQLNESLFQTDSAETAAETRTAATSKNVAEQNADSTDMPEKGDTASFQYVNTVKPAKKTDEKGPGDMKPQKSVRRNVSSADIFSALKDKR